MTHGDYTVGRCENPKKWKTFCPQMNLRSCYKNKTLWLKNQYSEMPQFLRWCQKWWFLTNFEFRGHFQQIFLTIASMLQKQNSLAKEPVFRDASFFVMVPKTEFFGPFYIFQVFFNKIVIFLRELHIKQI